MNNQVEEKLQTLIGRYPQLEACRIDIISAYESLEASYEKGRKLLIGGNGGSAADAEHIVGELMKGFVKPRQLSLSEQGALRKIDDGMGEVLSNNLQSALPAIAITGHEALSTAYLNDVDAACGFAQQVYGYGMEGDVFLGISTSGNSKNILYAAVAAKAKGLSVIGLTGRKGGNLKDIADICICVPEDETYKIQELHLPVYHALCLMLEERFFG